LFLLIALGIAPLAAAAVSAPMVREVYLCDFNEGKDMGDLMSARDFYLKQMEKSGQEPNTAFVWTPFKANAGFDFVWANNSDNLMEFARDSDAFNDSKEGQAAMDRFNTVATCTSHLSMRRQTFQAEGDLNPGPNGAVISSFACNYRDGHGPDDLEDLANHVSDVASAVPVADGAVGYVSVPGIGSGPNSADVIFYSVSGSLEKWAARNAAFQGSDGAPSLMRHLQTIVDCNGALFYGQRVVPPLE
jgi:hypothetical protein